MGVKRTYFCCLCRIQYDIKELHGIRWCGKGFRKVDAFDSERHLCQYCLDSAASVKAEYDAMRPVTPLDATP